jgi:peroxiredoxin
MPQVQNAPPIMGLQSGKKAVVVFFETDCPTCQLALPYLNSLKQDSVQVIGISQDDERSTREFVSQLKISYPVELD